VTEHPRPDWRAARVEWPAPADTEQDDGGLYVAVLVTGMLAALPVGVVLGGVLVSGVRL
jgi:hypothetical protein